MTVCFMYSILFMKLWSYVQVNMWCRQDLRQQKSTGHRKRTQSISIAQLREFIESLMILLLESGHSN